MPLLPALLLALPWPAAAEPSPAWLYQEEAKLFTDRDPNAAAALLDDPQFAELRQSDPQRHARWLAQATELSGLAHLLRTQTAPAGLVAGFENWFIDDPAGFGANPQDFLAWVKQRVPEAEQGEVALAAFDWTALPDAARQFMEKTGETRSDWNQEMWLLRLNKLKRWATKALAAEQKAPLPRSASQLEAMTGRLDDIELVLPEEWTTITDLESRAKSAVEQVQKGTNLAVAGGSAAGNAAIDSPDQTFDGGAAGGKATPRPQAPRSKKLTAQQNEVLTTMLKSRLLSDIGDVPLGKRVQDFYKTHPLDLAIGPLPEGTLAKFVRRTGQIVIGSQALDSWLAAQGRTRADLFKDGALMEQFVMLSEPTFVHEAEHQRQQAWRDTQKGEDDLSGQAEESEAMMAQAAFLLQKTAADPRFKAFFESNASQSELIQEDAELAARLKGPDAKHFEDIVSNDYYPEDVSPESAASEMIGQRQAIIAMIHKELARRTSGQTSQVSKTPLKPPPDLFAFSWEHFVERAPTSQLRQLFQQQSEQLIDTDDLYSSQRRRHTVIVNEMMQQSNWEPAQDSVPNPGAPR